MAERENQPEQPKTDAVEADLFGGLMEFHDWICKRLREAPLDEEEQKLVVERMGVLIDAEREDMKEKKDLDLSKRLTAVAKQLDRLIDELSE